MTIRRWRPGAASQRSSTGTDALRVGDSLTCDGGTFAGDEARTTAITTPSGTTVLLVAGRTATIQLTADLVGERLRCRGFGRSAGGVALSNLVTAAGPVRPAGALEPRGCSATRTGLPLTIEAPSSAAPGARITVVATLDGPTGQSRAALLLVKRSAMVQALCGASGRSRPGPARCGYGSATRCRGPWSGASGVTFQVVLATFSTRAAASAAKGLRAACDAGDARFALRIDG